MNSMEIPSTGWRRANLSAFLEGSNLPPKGGVLLSSHRGE
tara:strand:- start:625 stop:744 length:120 start_codon:yes stop_codon:yes gene_type:complete